MIGKTIGGYRVISQIGMGGMATVFKAHDAKMDRHVALKILPQQYSKDPSFRMRFEREARAIAQLEHLHILPIFDYGEDDGISFMAMRLMETGTLTDYIKAESPIPLAEVARIIQQIAGALDHAHSHGVLHRDIKPSNILVDAGANAYLTDFGIAKIIESSIDLTGTGIVGTPQYMSPEQCFGSRDITAASDQYALGVVLYEMVTGRTPYQAETPLALINMQITEAPLPPPTELRPDLPDATESVILKTLSREPETRYSSCVAMTEAFVKSLEAYKPDAIDRKAKRKPPVPVSEEAEEKPTKIAPPPVILADEQTQMLPAKDGVPAWMYGVLIIAILFAGFATAYQLNPDFKMAVEALVVNPTPTASVTTLAIHTPTITATATATNTATRRAATMPVAEIDTPGGTVLAEPCDQDDRFSGYCIYSENSTAQQILTDQDFVFWSEASWNPDGTQFTFSALAYGADPLRDNMIYIVNADGSGLYQLPQRSNDLRPTWSPDGELITYNSGCDLVVSAPDGRNLQTVWRNRDNRCVERMQWSPDSQWIIAFVYVGSVPENPIPEGHEVWLVPVSGGEIETIASVAYERNECSGDVAFSPDGQQIAFRGDDCNPVLVDRDNTDEQTRLRDFPIHWTGAVYPQWGEEREIVSTDSVITLTAPDNVVYAESCLSGSHAAICTYSSDGVQLSQIELEPGFGITSRPNWSPDGQQLTFGGYQADEDSYSNVPFYIVNVDGSDFHNVTRISNDLDPSWSPSGEWIAIHSGCDLALSSPDGSHNRTIWRSSMAGCVMSPQWSPDSQWIVMNVMPAGGNQPTHEIWTVSLETGEIYVIASFDNSGATHTEFDSYRLAFSPDGQQVAYYDENAQVVLMNRDGEGEGTVVSPFPVWWTGSAYPQWGIEHEIE